MPHLAPLNWLLAPALFWLCFFALSSILWWVTPSNFPSLPLVPTTLAPKWPWL